MHKLTLLLLAALLSLGIAAILIVSSRSQESRRSRNASAREAFAEQNPAGDGHLADGTRAQALWGEVIALRREVDSLKAELARLVQAPAAEQASAPPAADNEQETARAHAAFLAKVAESFLREPADPAWSSARRSTIRDLATGNASLRHAIQSVDCRSRTCRVEMRDDAAANLGASLSLFVAEMTSTLPIVTTDWMKAPDGTGTYILYMSES